MSAFIGLCEGAGEPTTAAAERVPGGGESHLAGAPADSVAPLGPGEVYALRDRQAPRSSTVPNDARIRVGPNGQRKPELELPSNSWSVAQRRSRCFGSDG